MRAHRCAVSRRRNVLSVALFRIQGVLDSSQRVLSKEHIGGMSGGGVITFDAHGRVLICGTSRIAHDGMRSSVDSDDIYRNVI